jgi:hypothetical protein
MKYIYNSNVSTTILKVFYEKNQEKIYGFNQSYEKVDSIIYPLKNSKSKPRLNPTHFSTNLKSLEKKRLNKRQFIKNKNIA